MTVEYTMCRECGVNPRRNKGKGKLGSRCHGCQVRRELLTAKTKRNKRKNTKRRLKHDALRKAHCEH
jgi:hypothetical protein